MTTETPTQVGRRFKIGTIGQLAVANAMLNCSGLPLMLMPENESLGEECLTHFTETRTSLDHISGLFRVHFNANSMIRGSLKTEEVYVTGTLTPNGYGGYSGKLEVVTADNDIPL